MAEVVVAAMRMMMMMVAETRARKGRRERARKHVVS